MQPRTKEMTRHVEVVIKALDLLECFHSQPTLTLKEMVDRTKMTRSRVTRLVGTLESRGFLLYGPEDRQFRLGPRLLSLGKVFETHNTLIALARPVLKDLVRLTGELASLYAMDGLERIALAREKGTHEISYSVAEGQRMELYAGAAGKALLAFTSSEFQTQVLRARPLKKLTSKTITDPRRLAQDLKWTRSKGYAVSDGERVSDVWSAAAPVFDHSQTVCASLGITGPRYRIPRRVQSEYIGIVKEKARELSLRLGWRGPLS